MKKTLAVFLLSAAILTPAFGQMGQAKIKVVMMIPSPHQIREPGTWLYEGHTNYAFEGKDPDLDQLQTSIVPLVTARGWSCWVTPSLANWSHGTVQIRATLDYVYDADAGARDLHVATVTVRASKSSDPGFVPIVFDTIPVVMDVGYHLLAERGPGGSAGGEILLYQLPENMPPTEFSYVQADPGYVFTGWTGQGVDLGCVLSDPDRPNVWSFDFWRYFVTLGQTKQVRLLATFAPENTQDGEQTVVEIDAGGAAFTVQFDNVVEPGHTEVSILSSGPTPPDGFRLGNPPTYYDISTTAEYVDFVTICISFDPSSFKNPSKLKLFHYEDGQWVDCTTSRSENTICGAVSSLSPFVICEPASIPVEVDVKPGSDANPINPKAKGTIPVAILGGADFDVAQIDPSSLDLVGLAVHELPNGKLQCSIDDVNSDGFDDLVCQFVNNRSAWSPGMTSAVLTGSLWDGTAIEGSDQIRLVP